MAARKKKAGGRKVAKKKTAAKPRRKVAASKTGAKRAAKKAPSKARRKAAPRAPRPPRSPAPPRWALALAGDWSRGAFVAGLLEALRRRGVLARVGAAAATGSAAVAAALAALGRWEELEGIFTELTARRLARPRHSWMANRAGRFWLASVTGVPSLFRADTGLRRLLHEQVDPLALRDAPLEIHFVATDLRSGAARSVSSRRGAPDEVMAALLAAASPAVLLPPVVLGPDRAPCVAATTEACVGVLVGELGKDGAPPADRLLLADTETAPPRREGSYRDIAVVARRAAELLAAPGSGARTAALLHALASARDLLGPKKFDGVLQGLPDAARAALPALLPAHGRPLLHLHPPAPGAAHALELDPAGSRAAFLAGGAAAEAVE